MDINGSSWNISQLCVQEVTFPWYWTVQSHRQGTCSIFPSGHAFQADLKINDNPYCPYCHFGLNDFPPSKFGAVMSNTKGPGQLILVTIVNYNRFWRLRTGKYFQENQEDEPRKTIDMYQTFRATVLGPQYIEGLLTVKHPWWSHCNLINMTEDRIELYDTFNTKGCIDALLFRYFCDQPIPPDLRVPYFGGRFLPCFWTRKRWVPI